MTSHVRNQLMEGRAVLPRVGSVVQLETQHPAYAVLDPDEKPVESVTPYLRDLALNDNSPATSRSYADDLLRWFRFLWLLNVTWDKAEHWLGEVEGIDSTLTFLRAKQAEAARLTKRPTTNLGIPRPRPRPEETPCSMRHLNERSLKNAQSRQGRSYLRQAMVMISRLSSVIGPRSQSPYWPSISKPASTRSAFKAATSRNRKLSLRTRSTVPSGFATVPRIVTMSPATESTSCQ
ncbi:hypothetical protein SDIAM103S_05887 [Streptomyces diastaticus subsp. diastaticus]